MVDRIVVGLLFTNAYIFSLQKKECYIIDPGDDAPEIVKRLTAMNLTPRGIICTHGHLDHVAAIPGIIEYCKTKDVTPPIAIHEKDAKYLGAFAEKEHSTSFRDFGPQGMQYFNAVFTPLPEPDLILKDGDSVWDTELITIHTPGHTKGSVCFYSENQEALFSGDTLFFEGVGRTDLQDSDPKAIISSIKEKLFAYPPTTRVFTGHGPDTTLEREMKNNPFLQVN
jgi:hydroxyacylglutathione hydrolase